MTLKKRKWRVYKILLLVAMLVVIGLVGSGCVQGLVPIGWSGGAVSDETLYIGSKEGRLVALNLTDESRLWGDPLRAIAQQGLFGCSPGAAAGGCGAGSSGVAIYGTPVVSEELVYIAGYNGKIYAYNTDSLAVRWVYPREGNLEPFVGGATVDNGRLYIGDSAGIVHALDADTGDKLWESPTGEKVWSTPAVSGDTVYIGSFDEKLYALDAADGSKKWEFIAAGSIMAPPVVEDGTVYVGSLDKHIYAINAATGNLKWKYEGENWFWGKMIIHEGIIYAGCLDGKVYALDADNGNKVAEYDLASPVAASPVIVNNLIVFASREGKVYTIDTGTNQLKQLLELEEEIYGPLTAHESIVYIHTQDLTLHRVNVINGAVLRSVSLGTP